MISNLIFKEKCIEYFKKNNFIIDTYNEEYYKIENSIKVIISFDKHNLPIFKVKDTINMENEFYYSEIQYMLFLINKHKDKINELIKKYYIWDI